MIESKILKKAHSELILWRYDEFLVLLESLFASNWELDIDKTEDKLKKLNSYAQRVFDAKKKDRREIIAAASLLADRKRQLLKEIDQKKLCIISNALLNLPELSIEALDFLTTSLGASEGRSDRAFHFYRERNKKIINLKKQLFIQQHGGLYCEACGFDFFSKYGERGKNYAEVHHNIPISDPAFTGKTRLSDLSVLCSNCHRMIHRKNPWISVAELKNIIYQQKVA